jgi:hypothetical protein
MGLGTGLDDVKRKIELRSLGRPDRSQSLYRLMEYIR